MGNNNFSVSTRNARLEYQENVLWEAVRTTDQLFSALPPDVPFTVPLDAAQGLVTDAAQISAAGLITFNQAVKFKLIVTAHAGRTSSSAEARFLQVFKMNGIIDNARVRVVAEWDEGDNFTTYTRILDSESSIGDTIETQWWTDSAGALLPDAKLFAAPCTFTGANAPCLTMEMIIKSLVL